ncbi:helix-turn-helix domain-containing protein [Alicyclobacillus acidocaldarius]|uniref:helix-turn-helix domain-containing protein n=1 Tax=Alicyclobacillus acidocaldarius TaxID=405212 RepID=UPI0005A0B006|nr:helix-turn-helix transcriptional regulator [Alicyclobacillus acidocaldarius]
MLEIRKARNLKQTDIANALGISVRTWQRYESNEREPTLSLLVQLADYLGVSLDFLAGRTDDPTPPPRTSSSSRDP